MYAILCNWIFCKPEADLEFIGDKVIQHPLLAK